MTKKINYEDDIFTLSLFVRTLSDVLKLEIDSEFFRERIEGDITFIHSTIGRIFDTLSGAPLFLKRHEYLTEIQRLKRAFVDLLDAVIDGRFLFAEFLGGSAERFRGFRQVHEEDIALIRSVLSQSGGREEEHIVSEDEFKILLSPTDDAT
jgi:hypothetical protein